MDYRLYAIADTGRILAPPRAMHAEDDSEALRMACDSLETETLELWAGARLVAKLKPPAASPESDCAIVLKP